MSSAPQQIEMSYWLVARFQDLNDRVEQVVEQMCPHPEFGKSFHQYSLLEKCSYC